MDKNEVAAVLEEIGTLLELQGENPFRCQAYSRAARALTQLETNLDEVVAAGKLDEVPGIGDTLRDKITTLVKTGHLPFYEDLKKKVPAGLVDMLRLPGLGPKKVKALHDELGIADLDQLKQACLEGKIAGKKGFGAKTQEKILEGIAFLGQVGNRVRLDQGMAVASVLVDALLKVPGLTRLEVCGSIRRRRETVKDIDLLACGDDPAAVMRTFVSLPQVMQVVGHGATKSSIVVQVVDETGHRIVLNADLRVVSAEQFPFALNYFTGSKEHNVALRQRAIDYGLKLNEYALEGPQKKVPCKEEEDIYRALDLDWIPPELREDTGEIAAAAAHALPRLLEADDLQGVFHCHSDWSDGRATLEEMAEAARKLGYKYLGIADHSQSLNIANGLTPERVRRQHEEIDRLNQKWKSFRLFKGTECDILPDGSLDFADQVLDSFDYVVASVHTHFNQTEEEMTRRIVRALEHPRVTMLGHATGRLLLRREGYKVDLEAVLQAAARHGKMIEINGNPYRQELDWVHCKRARALGIPIVINPDAHSTSEIEYARFGVAIARRGWLEKKHVFNTHSLAQVAQALEKMRQG